MAACIWTLAVSGLLMFAFVIAGDLQPDRWYAMSSNLIVKPGKEGTLYRESVELPIEVPPANSPCGRQGRMYLDSLLRQEEKHQFLNDEVRNNEDLGERPISLHDDELCLSMISKGFARPRAVESDLSEKETRFNGDSYREAALIAEKHGEGCIYSPEALKPSFTESNDSEESREEVPGPQLIISTRKPALQPGLSLPVGFQWRTHMRGLHEMTDFLFLDNGNMLILRKSGVVNVVDSSGRTLFPAVFDFRELCNDFFDRGAMSMVKAADYSVSHHIFIFFVYEHDPRPETYEDAKTARVIRVKLNSEENRAVRRSKKIIVGAATGAGCEYTEGQDCIPVEARGHVGGGLTFAGNYLYVAVGDQARASVTAGGHRAQQLGHYIGKVLRVNPNNGQGLRSNPYTTPEMSLDHATSKIFALGVRSPFGLESTRGRMPVAVGDVQWRTEEKISTVLPGKNLGWPCYEGNVLLDEYLRYRECRNFRNETRMKPTLTWGRDPGTTSAAMVGEFISPKGWPPLYRNVRVFGDMATQVMGFAKVSSDGTLNKLVQTVSVFGNPLRFRVDPANEKLYVMIIRQRRVMELSYKKEFEGISVVAVAPAVDAPLPRSNLEFAIKFSVNPLPNSVSQNSIFLEDSAGNKVPTKLTLRFAKRTVLLEPRSALRSGAAYDIVISNGSRGLRNLFGEKPFETQRISFTVSGATSDTVPPRVVSVSPMRSKRNVSISRVISIQFNDAISTPIEQNHFRLLRRRGANTPLNVPLTNFDYDRISKTVSFSSIDYLDYNACYYIVVRKQLTDRSGNAMGSQFRASFCTEKRDPSALTGQLNTPGLVWIDAVPHTKVNKQISFSGRMMTADGETVPANRIIFSLILRHCSADGSGCHEHSVYTIPGNELRPVLVPEHDGSYYFVISMRAQYKGNSGEVRRHLNVLHRKIQFTSAPSGAQITVNRETYRTPVQLDLACGSNVYIEASPVVGGQEFREWEYRETSGVVPLPFSGEIAREVQVKNASRGFHVKYA